MDATTPQSGYRLPIRFVGSGSEYFRIWIVNLLLTLVTLGLYYPFAKVRRLRYFHGATEVGGDPLSFHGDPWKMLRGYLLVAALVVAYSLAGWFSPAAGAIAFVAVAALWPALWQLSLKFRLANTGWRGLRFGFTGSRGGAYLAWLPLALPGVLFGALVLLLAPAQRGAAAAEPAVAGILLIAALPLVMLLALPAQLWWLKRYQQRHYRLGGEKSRFEVGLGAAYGLALRLFGMSMLFGLLLAIGVALFTTLLRGAFETHQPPDGPPVAALLSAALVFVLLQATWGAYLLSRLQNLVWNRTRSEHLHFESRLTFRRLAPLTLRNWLLTIATLGLYLPFAQVATARLRLESVTALSATDPALLLQHAGGGADDASGDAAADLLGIDLGL